MPNDLVSHLVRFTNALREAGVPVGTGEVEGASRSLLLFDPTDRELFRLALQANLVHRHEDLAAFDRLFEVFWPPSDLTAEAGGAPGFRQAEGARPELVLGAADAGAAAKATASGLEAAPPAIPYSPGEVFWAREVGASRRERIRRGEGWVGIRRLLVTIPGGMASRRVGASGRIDLGATLRDLLRAGGEPIRLRWRDRPARKPALILAADVSGSMEQYLAEVIELLLAAARLPGRVELFAFSTRLDRLTPLVRGFRRELARRRLVALAPRWSGGTGLGLAIARQILQEHGGDLRCEAHTGPGATFVLRLPVAAEGEGKAFDGSTVR